MRALGCAIFVEIAEPIPSRSNRSHIAAEACILSHPTSTLLYKGPIPQAPRELRLSTRDTRIALCPASMANSVPFDVHNPCKMRSPYRQNISQNPHLPSRLSMRSGPFVCPLLRSGSASKVFARYRLAVQASLSMGPHEAYLFPQTTSFRASLPTRLRLSAVDLLYLRRFTLTLAPTTLEAVPAQVPPHRCISCTGRTPSMRHSLSSITRLLS